MNSLLILLAISAATARPIDVAYLANEKDAAAIVEPLRAALSGSDPLVRTTAARVAGVRDEKMLVGDLRKAVEQETDATAAREELRSIALLGTDSDIDFARKTSEKWPPAIEDAVESMIARRADAFDIYFAKLHPGGVQDADDFFMKALWGRPDLTVAISSRLAGLRDPSAWRALLRVLHDSDVPLQPGIAAAVFNGPSEEMRNATVWYCVRVYAKNPDGLPEVVRAAFSDPKETPSDREAFGRELVRRMSGGDKKEDPRWLAWLDTKEADDLLAYNEPNVFALLTDHEFALRKNHCGLLPVECTMPAAKPMTLKGRVVSPKPVRQPEVNLPGELPAGLADAISSRCGDLWFGLANVTVDGAGRVLDLDLSHVQTRCVRELETILRLSYATNLSIASPRRTNDLIVSHGPRTTPCLDEDSPLAVPSAGLTRSGGKVVAPKVRRKVEPTYPVGLRGVGKASGNVFVIVEAVITKTGCIRSVRLMAQSPFAELNSSAVFAVSQWTFYPATLDGRPVDVLYNLTVHFTQ
ncbi:MAG TPA: energy transducer TonB [Thermoanaerobaculia bacterium]|jgi:TonB family protein